MQCIYDQQTTVGEGPLWDHRTNLFYWVDIEQHEIHSLQLDFNIHQAWTMPSKVGCLALAGEEDLLVALSNEIIQFTPKIGKWISLKETTISDDLRFNDGKCDPQGRFWVGSIDQAEAAPIGSLYRLDEDQVLITMDTGFTVSNGLGWSPDSQFMYFTDAPARTIYRYGFDVKTGNITNRVVFATVAEDAGYPDGLCVDSEGCVWSAHWMGQRITRYRPDGSIDREIETPVVCPTSCCFGGKDLNQLFVTSATRDLTYEEMTANPQNGGVFVMDTDIKGVVEVIYPVEVL